MKDSDRHATTLVVNGERMKFSGSVSISDILDGLGLKKSRIAVELNRVVIKKDDHGRVFPSDGDKLEIVQFVGGG